MRDVITASLWCHTDDVVLALREVVLTYDEVAPRRAADVVGAIEERVIVRLNDQRQPLLPQADAEHLAELLRPAVGAAEIHAAVREGEPLAARELGAALRETLCPRGAWGGMRALGVRGRTQQVQLGLGILDAHPVDRERIAQADRLRRLPVLRPRMGAADHAQRLEHAAARVIAHAQSRWLRAAAQGLGAETIEEPVLQVLAHVGEPRERVHGHGLVPEAPHRLERDRVHQALAPRVHFEDVAVCFAHAGVAARIHGSTGPGLNTVSSAESHEPQGVSAAGAVAQRAREARERRDESPLGVHPQRRRAAPGLAGRTAARAAGRPVGHRPCSTRGCRTRMVKPSGPANAAMPSCSPGVGDAVAHQRVETRVALPVLLGDARREQVITKSRGQVEEAVRIGHERAVALRREPRAGRDGGERPVEADGHDEPGRASERGAEERSAGPAHGVRSIAPRRPATQTAAAARARRYGVGGTIPSRQRRNCSSSALSSMRLVDGLAARVPRDTS